MSVQNVFSYTVQVALQRLVSKVSKCRRVFKYRLVSKCRLACSQCVAFSMLI